jgi:hypothetical protein
MLVPRCSGRPNARLAINSNTWRYTADVVRLMQASDPRAIGATDGDRPGRAGRPALMSVLAAVIVVALTGAFVGPF